MAGEAVSTRDDLLKEFDRLIEMKGYANRSEGVRDAVRQMLAGQRIAENEDVRSLGCVVYMYNHMERALSFRLVETRHHHHDIQTATMHLHIDAEENSGQEAVSSSESGGSSKPQI